MKIILGITGGLGNALFLSHCEPLMLCVTRDKCDVVSDGCVKKWADSIASMLVEPFHILNATGLSVSGMLHKSAMYDESWRKMVDVNLLGNARLLKYLRPVFKERPGSTFTMLGSVTTRTKPVGTAIYTATKSALEGLTRVGACEMAPFARVNLLELGYFSSGMIRQVPDIEGLKAKIPLGRLGEAEDLWRAWQFVIECAYVTGAIIPVNGGLV